MIVSVIMPVYQMGSLAGATLRSLGRQRLAPGTRLEILVIDDGSDDATHISLLESARLCPGARVIRRPRDEHSCRSLARNVGLEHAAGELVVFIDAGVLVDRDFVGHVLVNHAARLNGVMLYRVLGLLQDGPPPEDLLNADAESLSRALRELQGDPGWVDPRETLALGTDGDFSRLPAPWLFAWTALMSVERALARQVGGFDVHFKGWGSEDNDFGLSLADAGAVFSFAGSATGLHLPHPRVGGTHSEENRRNRLRLHEKRFRVESELFVSMTGPECNAFLRRLRNLHFRYAVPPWRSDPSATALGPLLRCSGRSLLVGCRDEAMLRAVAPTHVLDPSAGGRAWHTAGGLDLLGCNTPFASGHFELAVVWDASRLLPRRVLAAQLQELARISKKIVCVFSSGTSSLDARFREIDGWNWHGQETFISLFRELVMELSGDGVDASGFTALVAEHRSA